MDNGSIMNVRLLLKGNALPPDYHHGPLPLLQDKACALLFYHGAASRVGQSYIGSLLLTQTGAWPESEKVIFLRFRPTRSSCHELYP